MQVWNRSGSELFYAAGEGMLMSVAMRLAAGRLAIFYGNISSHMKTTVDLPDELLIARGPIRWVTARGGLPPGADVRDRARMHEWIRGER